MITPDIVRKLVTLVRDKCHYTTESRRIDVFSDAVNLSGIYIMTEQLRTAC